MINSLISNIGCIGFNKPVHCFVALVALVCNALLKSIRNARNATIASTRATSSDIPLKPTCSYAVLVALHVLAFGYFANQLAMLRRQSSLAKCVCLMYFSASFLIFVSLLTLYLPSTDDTLMPVFAESLCFLVLVTDFAKPLRAVKQHLGNDGFFLRVLAESFVDLLMQLLIISLGILFRLPAVLRACTYATVALISTFVSFYLVVPSVVAFALSLDAKFNGGILRRSSRPEAETPKSKNINKRSLPSSNEVNPLARRVKFIMSAAILLVHAHSKLKPSSATVATQARPAYEQHVENTSMDENRTSRSDHISDWSDFDQVSAADWGLTLVLAVVICLRFLLFSDSHDSVPEIQVEEAVPDEQQNEEPPCSKPKRLFKVDEASFGDARVCQQRLRPAPVMQFRPARKRLVSDSALIAKSNEEIVEYYINNNLPLYTLEAKLMAEDGDKETGANRAVAIRRGILAKRNPNIAEAIEKVPFADYKEFANIVGACCENVVGTVPLPVGLAGPLPIDGTSVFLPMATTEGCLVASVNRGCKVLATAGGVTTVLLNDGMSRAPVVRLPDVTSAAELRGWLKDPEIFEQITIVFNGTSRFCRLSAIEPFQAGVYVFIRFVAQTGDAMGMNMVSRACESALSYIMGHFPACRLLSLSGNCCADKKAAAVNWLMGRGKSVISEAIVPREVICNALRTTPEALVRLNTAKNLIGSAVAGAAPGSFNAHAANILTALYIATGQDVAQVVESSACLTVLEVTGDTPVTSVDEEPQGGDLHITCTLPTLEVGTIGGGTILGPQKSCLEMLGVAGSSASNDDANSVAGGNARRLARIAAAAVLAGELSLLAALATNQLMPAHLRLNRSHLSISASLNNNPTNRGPKDS